MNPIARNIFAVVAGIVVCMLVNGGIISLSASLTLARRIQFKSCHPDSTRI